MKSTRIICTSLALSFCLIIIGAVRSAPAEGQLRPPVRKRAMRIAPPPPSSNFPKGNSKMSIDKEQFGKLPDGAEVDLYTLTNANGLKVKIMTYGATIIAVEAPDRDGKPANVVLHLDTLAEYGLPVMRAV